MNAAAYKAFIQSLEPELYWALDSVDGATDLSGNGNDGTWHGSTALGGDSSAPPVAEGGSSTAFNDIDTYITSSYAHAAGGVRTYFVWLERAGQGNDGIVGSDDVNGPLFALNSSSDDARLQPDGSTSSGQATWSDVWPGTGLWVPCALIVDDSNDEAELFIAGVSEGVSSFTGSMDGGDLVFGARVVGETLSAVLQGKAAHFAVWERALDPEEIRALAQGPPAEPEPEPEPTGDPYKDLVLSLRPRVYWALDAAHGASDLSGWERDGTGQGGISIGGSSNSPFATGGGSTEFDGDDDAITRSDYDPWADAGTIMVWLRRRNNDTDHTILADTSSWKWLANIDEQWTPDDESEYPTWPGTDVDEHTWIGEWGCHVLTLDGANAELWINGESVGVKAYSAAPPSPQELILGLGWDGHMAHFAVFDRVLAPEEIEALSEAPPIPDPDPFEGPRWGFAVGGEAHELSPEELARELDAAKAAGAKWIRFDLHWTIIEATEGNYDWSAFDAVVDAVLERAMVPLCVLTYTPSWARTGGSFNRPPDDPADFAAFAAAAAEHYSSKVTAYEIWNEPNLNGFFEGADPEAYVPLLTAAYDAIKGVDPDLTVITGGLSPAVTDGTNTDPRDFLSGIYEHGGGGHFDAVAHHPYCWPARPGDDEPWSAWNQMYGTSPSLRSIMVENGDADKRIWATEWGVPTRGGPTDEEDQAEHLRVALEQWWNLPWVGPLLVYEVRDGSTADSVGESYGLLREDFSEKPAYAVYKSLVAGGVSYVPSVPPTIPRPRLTVETPSGRGFDLTHEAEGLRWSSVNPGGDEMCTFSLAREWLAANPELVRLSTVRVTCGLDVLFQGRLEEPDRSLNDTERITLTAYGMGVRGKDSTFRALFVDRSVERWGPPTLNQRLALADNDVFATGFWNANADEQSLAFEGTTGSIPAKAAGVLMYEAPQDLKVAEFRYRARQRNNSDLIGARLYYSDDDSELYQSWSVDTGVTADDTLRRSQLSSPARFLALEIRGNGAISPSNPPKRTYVLFAVYGDHGLVPVDNGDEPAGFYVSQLIGWIVGQVPGLKARRIDDTSFVVEHSVFGEPTTYEDGIAELDAFEGYDWGTWGPDSVLDRSDTGYFDYKRPDRETAHWFARRAEFDDLDLTSETATLYNRVEVSFTDERGDDRIVTRELYVPELGDTVRTAQIQGGTLTERLAEQLGDAFLRHQGSSAPARGSGTIAGTILHHQRGRIPAMYLRADGSNVRIPDVLPSETMLALSDEPDRRTTFPIKRVEHDASELPVKTTVELDQSADALSVLQARLEHGAEFLPAQPAGRRRRRRSRRR